MHLRIALGVSLAVLWTTVGCTSIKTDLKTYPNTHTLAQESAPTDPVVVYRIQKSTSGMRIGLGFQSSEESLTKKSIRTLCETKTGQALSKKTVAILHEDARILHALNRERLKEIAWYTKGGNSTRIERFNALDVQTQVRQPEQGRYRALGVFKVGYDGRHKKKQHIEIDDVGQEVLAQGAALNANLIYVIYRWTLKKGRKKANYRKVWIGAIAFYYHVDCSAATTSTGVAVHTPQPLPILTYGVTTDPDQL